MDPRVGSKIRAATTKLPAMTFVLILAGGSLASCGNSGHPATARTTVTHPAIVAAPIATRGGSVTRARAIANAINLTSADLPGYISSPEKESNSKAEHEELARCMGATDPRLALTEVNSENFKRTDSQGSEELQSAVTVMPSTALAARNLVAARSAQAEVCLKSSIDKEAVERSNKKINYSPAAIGPIPAEVLGVSGSYGLHTAIDVIVTRGPFYILYSDLLGLVDGPIEVTLTTVSTRHPVALTTEQHLLSLLLERARAQLR